jgi:hypothetical protein
MAEATSKATPAPKKAASKATTKAGAVDAKAKKPELKKTAPKKAAVAEKTPTPVKSNKAPVGKKIVVSDEQRYRMIAEAAYYLAESRHFKSDPLRDWIEAERDIALLLGENK